MRKKYLWVIMVKTWPHFFYWDGRMFSRRENAKLYRSCRLVSEALDKLPVPIPLGTIVDTLEVSDLVYSHISRLGENTLIV